MSKDESAKDKTSKRTERKDLHRGEIKKGIASDEAARYYSDKAKRSKSD